MKIEYVTGCVCDSLTIDGVETSDMSPKEIQDCLLKLIPKVSDIGDLQRILTDFVELMGDYKDLGTCDECFDHICSYTYEVS